MRLLSTSLALLVAGAALAAPVSAHADTGGSRLYYVGTTGVWTAPVAHPSHRSKVPRPHASDGTPVYPEQVVPSPNGGRLAISTHARRSSGQRVFVTGPKGQHPRQVARFDNDPDQGPAWKIDSLAWRGDHRLYFSMAHGTDLAIYTVRVPAHGKAGPVSRVPHSTGLFGLTVDPTSARLAAVPTTPGACDGGSTPEATPDIVVLNLRTHQLRHLATVPFPADAVCPSPSSLAWSPDGSQIAFAGLALTRQAPHILIRVVETVATGAHQSHRPRIVTAQRRKLSVGHVAWQSAHSVWFEAGNDLYSIGLQGSDVAYAHRRTHNPSALKFNLSFG